jgi:hypothetical protein
MKAAEQAVDLKKETNNLEKKSGYASGQKHN